MPIQENYLNETENSTGRLEKREKNAPVFQRGEMDRHIGNSPRKRISGDKIP